MSILFYNDLNSDQCSNQHNTMTEHVVCLNHLLAFLIFSTIGISFLFCVTSRYMSNQVLLKIADKLVFIGMILFVKGAKGRLYMVGLVSQVGGLHIYISKPS